MRAPLSWHPRLRHGTDAERANWRLTGNGVGVHWSDVDEDTGVEGLVLGKRSRESEEIQLELAISLFLQEKLSFGKAGEVAGVDFWTFQQILGSRGIAPHYDIAELHEDLATIERLRQK